LIEKFGADGVRRITVKRFCRNDIMFDEELCNQGKGLPIKFGMLSIKGWEVSDTIPQPESSKVAIEWYEAQQTFGNRRQFRKYRISEALMEPTNWWMISVLGSK
jgi:valyl-tRNA synthetase